MTLGKVRIFCTANFKWQKCLLLTLQTSVFNQKAKKYIYLNQLPWHLSASAASNCLCLGNIRNARKRGSRKRNCLLTRLFFNGIDDIFNYIVKFSLTGGLESFSEIFQGIPNPRGESTKKQLIFNSSHNLCWFWQVCTSSPQGSWLKSRNN